MLFLFFLSDLGRRVSRREEDGNGFPPEVFIMDTESTRLSTGTPARALRTSPGRARRRDMEFNTGQSCPRTRERRLGGAMAGSIEYGSLPQAVDGAQIPTCVGYTLSFIVMGNNKPIYTRSCSDGMKRISHIADMVL